MDFKQNPEALGVNIAEPKASSQLIKLADISSYLETASYLIHRWLPMNCKAIIIADYGSYKTFFAISIALAIATGSDWFGRKVTQRPVLYIVGEHVQGFLRRIIGAVKNDSYDNPFYILPEPIHMLNNQEAEKASDFCKQIHDETNQKPVVIVDTLNRNFGDGDESSTKDMTNFTNSLDKHIFPYSSGILIPHHTPKSSKTSRGSNVLPGYVDTELILTKEKANLTGKLEFSKIKDDEEGSPLILKFAQVDTGLTDSIGEPVTTLVLEDVVQKADSSSDKPNTKKNGIRNWLEKQGDFHDIDTLSERYEEFGYSNKANLKKAIIQLAKSPGNGIMQDGDRVGFKGSDS